MINSVTGQPLPCPICNSTRVRWRRRRVYDVPLTWTRHFLELLLSSTLVPGGRRTAISRGEYRREYRETLREEMLEANTGGRTATSFWRCPDCKNKGQLFDTKPERGHVDDRTRPPV